jgi:hypothetical protein
MVKDRGRGFLACFLGEIGEFGAAREGSRRKKSKTRKAGCVDNVDEIRLKVILRA